MVRLTDRPDMTLDVYLGRKTTIQHYNNLMAEVEVRHQLHVLFIRIDMALMNIPFTPVN